MRNPNRIDKGEVRQIQKKGNKYIEILQDAEKARIKKEIDRQQILHDRRLEIQDMAKEADKRENRRKRKKR